jgi:hypothetical protein
MLKVTEKFVQTEEKTVNKLVENLVKAHARPVASAILRAVKFQKRDEPVKIEPVPKANSAIPKGPFIKNREGALLVFVPRTITSRLIDELSGVYGYSHVAVDCGETDLDTGKPVMIESMTGDIVRRRFLDEYGGRHFARIPISKTGIDSQSFFDCVSSKVGEKYDYLEALTWGQVDDPARQVCSNLATDCLSQSMLENIVQHYKAGHLNENTLSIHRRNGHLDIFMSPNGFAEYFGIPRGRDLKRPNQVVQLSDTPKRTHDRRIIYWGAACLSAGLVAAWLLSRKNRNEGLFPAVGS